MTQFCSKWDIEPASTRKESRGNAPLWHIAPTLFTEANKLIVKAPLFYVYLLPLEQLLLSDFVFAQDKGGLAPAAGVSGKAEYRMVLHSCLRAFRWFQIFG